KLAKQCWPLEGTAGAYARFLDVFTPLGAALDAAMPIAAIDAFVARILLIHEYRRIILRDPALPPELLPPAWPGEAGRPLPRPSSAPRGVGPAAPHEGGAAKAPRAAAGPPRRFRADGCA